MGILRDTPLGETRGSLLFESDHVVYGVLARFASELGLPESHAIGYKVPRGRGFYEDLQAVTADAVSSILLRDETKTFVGVILRAPIISNICEVELIASDDGLEVDPPNGLNQLHCLVDTETVMRVAESRGATVETRGSNGQFKFAKLPYDEDTHVKVRDHTTIDLLADIVVHSIRLA